jgi:hypothetical protein
MFPLCTYLCVAIPTGVWPAAGCVAFFSILYGAFLLGSRGSRSFYFDPQDYAFYEKENLGDRKLPIAAVNAASTFAALLENIGVSKLIITLAAASIAFGGSKNPSSGIFTAKIVLAFSILYGVTFVALLQFFYDDYT